jgi:hypothetical protein
LTELRPADRPALAARGIGRVGVVLLAAGAAVIALTLLAAIAELLDTVVQLGGPRGPNRIVLLVLAGGSAALAAAAVIGSILLPGPRHGRAALAGSIVLFLVVRILVVAFFDGPVTSDWSVYHRLAQGWALGAPPLANYSMGYPALLGEAYRLAGASPAVGEAVNVFVGTVGAVLLAIWVNGLRGPTAAALAVSFLALAPSQALFTVLLGAETLYSTAVIAIALLATGMLRAVRFRSARPAVLWALGCGVVLGLSAWVRATSLVLVPVLVLLPFLVARRRHAAVAALTLALAAALSLAPIVAANRALLDRWSPSSSLFTGWQLYVGMNLATAGHHSPDDVARVNQRIPSYDPSRLADEYAQGIFDRDTLRLSAERDELALEMAIERVRDNGLAVIGMLPAKFGTAWASAGNSASWALGQGPSEWPTGADVARFLAQLWWVAALGGAVAWFLLLGRRRPLAGLVTSAIVVPIAASLLILEVQPRYHEYVVPLIAALAALAADALYRRWRWQRAAGGQLSRGPGRRLSTSSFSNGSA